MHPTSSATPTTVDCTQMETYSGAAIGGTGEEAVPKSCSLRWDQAAQACLSVGHTGPSLSFLSCRYRQSLQNAKSARLNQLSSYANNDYQGECSRVVSNCAKQTSCSLQGCVPFSLQWSCMEPTFFASGRTKLVYIFGSSRVRSHLQGIDCMTAQDKAGLLHAGAAKSSHRKGRSACACQLNYTCDCPCLCPCSAHGRSASAVQVAGH